MVLVLKILSLAITVRIKKRIPELLAKAIDIEMCKAPVGHQAKQQFIFLTPKFYTKNATFIIFPYETRAKNVLHHCGP
jgi:hypothetical protein